MFRSNRSYSFLQSIINSIIRGPREACFVGKGGIATAPNGMKCRDIKLHEEKYRKTIRISEKIIPILTVKKIGRRTNTNTQKKNERSKTIRSGNIEYDRWWLRNFAQVIFDTGYFDEKHYKEMLNMIERELSRMYRKAA